MDAVCSVASEDIQMDKWGLDVVLSASQKGLGAPPGLSILIASQKALAASPQYTTCTLIFLFCFIFARSMRHVERPSPDSTLAGKSMTRYTTLAFNCTDYLEDGFQL